MQFKTLLLGFSLCCASVSSFAADQLITEETAPSAAEGALTADQIQPVLTQKPAAPSQPQQTSQTTTTTTTNSASPPVAAPAQNNQPAALQ